jgi:hypothetical protein
MLILDLLLTPAMKFKKKNTERERVSVFLVQFHAKVKMHKKK